MKFRGRNIFADVEKIKHVTVSLKIAHSIHEYGWFCTIGSRGYSPINVPVTTVIDINCWFIFQTMLILTEKGLLTKNDIEKLVLKLDEESFIVAINLPLHGFLQPKMQASTDFCM